MRVLEQDPKRGSLKLKIDTINDLVWLYFLLEEGDVITMRTVRRVKSEGGRPDSGERVPMTVTIKLEKVKMDDYGQRLRMTGIVTRGPERYGIQGKHHTLNLGVGGVVEIEKKEWSDAHVSIIKEAVESSKRPTVVIVALDERNATVALVDNFEIKEVTSVSGEPFKDASSSYESALSRSFKELEEILNRIIEGKDVKAIIVCGPGFFKRLFLKYLENKGSDLLNRVHVCDTSSATMSGVREAIKRGVLDRVLGELEIARSSKIMEKFLELVSRGSNLISYGIDEVHRAVTYGAAESALISSDLLFNKEHREKVLDIMEKARNYKTELHVVKSDTEVGEAVKSFGGAVAILRYNI